MTCSRPFLSCGFRMLLQWLLRTEGTGQDASWWDPATFMHKPLNFTLAWCCFPSFTLHLVTSGSTWSSQELTRISAYSRFSSFAAPLEPSLLVVSMAVYDDQVGDEYYMDDQARSFVQDLVYTLDAGVRHTVNQALAQAIRPNKHHLLGFAEQQGRVAPLGVQALTELSLSGGSQTLKQSTNLHAADFESLIRSITRDHGYNATSS
ncbi:hypothetical protein NDU88_007208 [Pleurodeles waltl]|uniref:Uncharacterized protein n=1 Tax=Pleurodeles waltl TaxID=8319 RepID=A0AAV7RPL8_PLEWA|nr:hypothetical protein NDU88_007208 [Pleurodeles waltl]